MTSIVIVEDEPNIREIVSLYLTRAGYAVNAFSDGMEALESFADQLPDLVILDVMLPGMDGFSLTRNLRDRSDVPIILLTSRREESDRIAGLELGADDYVVKPFSPQELVSRVRAVLRRTHSKMIRSMKGKSISQVFRLIHKLGELSVEGHKIELTVKEFDLLYHLASHPGQVFTRDQLLESVWGTKDYIDPGTVTVHIRRLREKIEENPTSPLRLVTVWGVGYKFES